MAANAMSPHPYSVHNKIAGDEENADADAEVEAATVVVGPDVTRHIMVKSSAQFSTQVLEKAVVLRRIRQRKRVNKFRAVVGALFSSPFSDKNDGDKTRQRKWVDEPFTSL